MSNENKPLVVCLSGATRFKSAFEYLRARLTEKGHVVVGPEIFVETLTQYEDFYDQTSGDSLDVVDPLQLRKIEMADAVFVVNPGNFIAPGTRQEIAYAKELGKPVYFHEEWYEPEYLGDDTFWQATNYPLPENA